MDRPWVLAGAVDTFVDARPDEVYAAVADVTRTGERSPECHAAAWLPGRPPGVVGSRFRGRNKAGIARWSRVCEVVEAEPGRRFTFRTVPERLDPSRRDSTTWRFTFEEEEGGTRVTHSYEITVPPLRPFKAVYGRVMPHHRDARPQMAATLAALKATLEADRHGRPPADS